MLLLNFFQLSFNLNITILKEILMKEVLYLVFKDI